MQKTLEWNPQVKIIVSDVDETIAAVYTPAEPEMIQALASVLTEIKLLILISGHGLHGILSRITDQLPSQLRSKILIGHCSATEVWGFNPDGTLHSVPYYSLYKDKLTPTQKTAWRTVINQLIEEFKLKVYSTRPKPQFIEDSKGDPLSIMLDDRGPQITFEVVNGTKLTGEQLQALGYEAQDLKATYDFRSILMERAKMLLAEAGLPISPRLAGVYAIDFCLDGVSKTTAIHYILQSHEILDRLGITPKDLNDPTHFEIWGDKFSTLQGGTDRHMSEALPKEVRSIDFREEDPAEFLPGYNTVIWPGERHLHQGLLEYLQSRKY